MSKKKNGHGGARSGAGRPALPKSQKRVTRGVSLPPRVWDELERLGKKHHRGRSGVVEDIVEYGAWAATRPQREALRQKLRKSLD